MRCDLNIIAYVTEEVQRQGHDTRDVDGLSCVSYMLDAWCYALQRGSKRPTVDDAITLGKLVERYTNAEGLRTCGVTVGEHVAPNWQKLPVLLVELFESMNHYKPMEFYKEFETIHPFIDGNGRTGKVLLNWLNHSLLDPIFPPANLWGREIRNP